MNEGRAAFALFVLTAIAVIVFREWWILAVYAFVLLFWVAFQARRRVLVEEFVDNSREPPDNGDGAGERAEEAKRLRGAATLLVVALARLEALYRVVDEQRAIGTVVGEGTPLDATVKVEALSAVLQRAVSAESRVSVGPISIPIGALMGIFGRLVEGPQLSGALHRDGRCLILTAQLTGGGGRNLSWRVKGGLESFGAADHPDRSPLINEMIEQLACRMFADLTLAKSVNWRATEHFIEALRAFRRCLRVPRGRKLNLKKAERELIMALSEDDAFVLVFYNLGVVYTELWRMADHEADAMRAALDVREMAPQAKDVEASDHLHAAEAAFARAIEQDPGRWEPYYALGLTRFERGRRDSVVEQCERVLALRPSLANRAKAYDLKGLAEYSREQPLHRVAKRSARKAAALSLRALRRAELKRASARGSEIDPVPGLKDQATRCLLNYALVLAHEPPQKTWRARARLRRIKALFGLALSLTNKDAVLHFEFGKIAEGWERLDVATREFTHATRIDPDHALYWAQLGAVRAKLYKAETDSGAAELQRKEARHACNRALEVINLSSVAEEDKATRRLIAETFNRIGDAEQSRRVRAMAKFAKKIGVLEWNQEVPPEWVVRLESWRGLHRAEGKEWEAAHLERLLGVAKLNRDQAEQAEQHFRASIALFERVNPSEIRRYAIRARLAKAVGAQGKETALAEAERALAVDPLRKLERNTLGHMYFALHDYEHAREAWENARFWSPNDPELCWVLSECHRRLADEETRAQERHDNFEKAAKYLEDALELYGGEGMDDRLRAHYWLGRLYGELRDFRKVIAHLRIVQTKPELSVIADLHLAEAFRRVKRYRQAEEHFTRVIEIGGAQLLDEPLSTVGVEVQDTVPLRLVVAEAYCGRASCDAERDGDLDRASTDLESADNQINALAQEPSVRGEGDVQIDLASVRSRCVDCRGWVLLKQGNPEGSIKLLQDAVLLGAEGETYLHLALAYEAMAAQSGGSIQLALLARARAACRHAGDTDVAGDASSRLDEISARLEMAGLATSHGGADRAS